jgi:mono/diheme cytochrome c family protein
MRIATRFAVWRLIPWSLLFVLLALLPVLPADAGGWATFMLLELPESPRAGERIDLSFVARAHGKTPFHFAKGEAKFVFRHLQTGETVDAAAMPATKYVGTHTASVVLPSAGEWAWELRPGGYPVLKLQPLTVLPGKEAALIARGKALFAAKGCVTCHRNDAMDEQWTVELGPNLTNYVNTMASLDAWLANPAAVKPEATMPALGLRPDEIDALVAFLTADSRPTARR